VELTCDEGELEGRLEDASRREFGKLASVEQYRIAEGRGALFAFRPCPGKYLSTPPIVSAAASAQLISEHLQNRKEGGSKPAFLT
jgi:hypothetical protein